MKVRRVGLEEPADVRVPEAKQHAEKTLAFVLRRMRVVGRISVLVVTAVVGDPIQQ